MPCLSEIEQIATLPGDEDVVGVAQSRRAKIILTVTGSGVDVEQSTGSERLMRDGERRVSPHGTSLSVVYGRPNATSLMANVPDIAERSVFMCGPDAFMVAMDAVLRRLGVASSAIHSEEFYF